MASAVLLVAAFFHPRLRDAEGFLAAPFCWAFALSAALAVLGAACRHGAARAGFWLALALLGQATALQLITAGPGVGYQHYRPRAGWELAFLALQALIVLIGARGLLPGALGWLRKQLSLVSVIVLALLAFFSSAKISRPLSGYFEELLFASGIGLVQLANVVLFAASLPSHVLARWRDRWGRLGAGEAHKGALEPVAYLGALWSFLLAALLSFFVYERHPHVPDEVAYLIHAAYLAEGRLSLPAPPVPAGFELDLMLLDGGRWFSPVPIGWPLVLALGSRAGYPWLVNPALGGAAVLLLYLLARELADRSAARLAVLLLCVSPWFAFMNMSFMTHSLTLVCALLAAFATLRARRSRGLLWAFLGGAGVGFLALVRPLEALAVGACTGLWVLGGSSARFQPRQALAWAAGAVACAAIALPYNKHLTGKATKFPIMDYVDKVYGPGKNELGFGPEKGLGWEGLDPFPGHGLPDAFVNSTFNVFAIHVELLGWSIGSLLVCYFGLLRAPRDRLMRAMLLFLALLVFLHGFYWFSGGPDFGARYWYLAIAPLVLITARTLQHLDDSLGQRLRAAALALILSSLVCFFPWRAIDKYHHYRGMRPDVRELAQKHGFGPSLILVRGERHPDYASAAIYNPLDLDAPVPIYAWDRSPDVRAALLARFPDRPIWLVNGPSITGSAFAVLKGPLNAKELARSQ
jgi:hypothetical protein